MDGESMLHFITNAPDNPFDLFQKILEDVKENSTIHNLTMNLATRNEQFGVANRTVQYRGLMGSDIIFVTERNSKKYEEIKKDPRVAATFLFIYNKNDLFVTQQIRILGKAVELSEDEIKKLWQQEPVFAKIRSHVCECGRPVKWEELKAKHDAILEKYKCGEEKLEQTESYTAFRIIADIADFYQDGDRHVIPGHVLYKQNNNMWTKETSCP